MKKPPFGVAFLWVGWVGRWFFLSPRQGFVRNLYFFSRGPITFYPSQPFEIEMSEEEEMMESVRRNPEE